MKKVQYAERRVPWFSFQLPPSKSATVMYNVLQQNFSLHNNTINIVCTYQCFTNSNSNNK